MLCSLWDGLGEEDGDEDDDDVEGEGAAAAACWLDGVRLLCSCRWLMSLWHLL